MQILYHRPESGKSSLLRKFDQLKKREKVLEKKQINLFFKHLNLVELRPKKVP